MPDSDMVPNIKAIGVHVECNCPQPQNVEALGLSMDNYEARSCTCLCGAQTCCCCLKEVGSTHSAGRASAHSSNLESQIILSDTDGGGSSLVSVPSNSGLPMDVTNGSEFTFGFDATIGDEFDLGSSSINDDSDFSPRNKIGPTCNDQALTWMIARCSRKFGILGGKDNGFACDESQTVTADNDICGTYIQALQTRDQGPQRPVRMSTAPDSCSW
ncbi:hypothetical protein CMV_025253 [Castanea mollissima]|uniref:Uncharacterized protein n=1 Tax=Castanea mollissima TaxID=60419 RepID=A0A8J4VH03_9ROSI|nr:hypothetical protein CMV_025253 [Castanea mollissima]